MASFSSRISDLVGLRWCRRISLWYCQHRDYSSVPLFLFHKGIKLFSSFLLCLCSGSECPGKPSFSWILESFGGGERNFRKTVYWSRSLIKSEGVPLDPLTGDLHDLPKSLALASNLRLSFSFSWVCFGLKLFWFVAGIFIVLSIHWSLDLLLHWYMQQMLMLPTFEPSVYQVPGWSWGYNGAQTQIWFLQPRT